MCSDSNFKVEKNLCELFSLVTDTYIIFMHLIVNRFSYQLMLDLFFRTAPLPLNNFLLTLPSITMEIHLNKCLRLSKCDAIFINK